MLPKAFRARMENMLGGHSDEFFQTFDAPAWHGLRINPLKNGAKKIPGQWAICGLSPVPWASDAYYYPDVPVTEENAFRPGRHPYHEAGAYYIQEPSAMAAAPCLEVEEGDIVLDLCAAPGGKSTQLAGALHGTGLLVSNEINPSRAKTLSGNIERMGIQNALVFSETPQRLAAALPGFFDKILVDAPCSGEGMFRKNEDACGEWSPENVQLCAQRQDMVLDCAAELLCPRGRITYSTCTFAPEEDEGAITRFLSRHPEFHIVPAEKKEGFSDADPSFYPGAPEEIRGAIRIWPQKAKGEGHFIAALERDGQEGNLPPEKRLSSSRFQKGVSLSACPPLKEFLESTLDPGCSLLKSGILEGKHLLAFGDQWYLMPEHMPSLKGLKALRPGLHLGTLKKGRFEPSHALALALSPEDVLRSVDLPSGVFPESRGDEDPSVFTAKRYLKGETTRLSGGQSIANGWTLVATGGMSLGWGKIAGGTLKNHYPKGLRQ